jgi:hypothetical protein
MQVYVQSTNAVTVPKKRYQGSRETREYPPDWISHFHNRKNDQKGRVNSYSFLKLSGEARLYNQNKEPMGSKSEAAELFSNETARPKQSQTENNGRQAPRRSPGGHMIQRDDAAEQSQSQCHG